MELAENILSIASTGCSDTIGSESSNDTNDISVFGEYAPKSFADEIRKQAESLNSQTCVVEKKFEEKDVFVFTNKENTDLRPSHSLLLEEWEGCIKEVFSDRFIAHLYKPDSNSKEVIEGEFTIDDVVPEGNRHLVVKGMVFYWNIGKEVKKSGTVSNNDYLIFRRMPSWKNFDIERESEIADNFFEFD